MVLPFVFTRKKLEGVDEASQQQQALFAPVFPPLLVIRRNRRAKRTPTSQRYLNQRSHCLKSHICIRQHFKQQGARYLYFLLTFFFFIIIIIIIIIIIVSD
eukprot:gene8790-6177_t